MSVTGIELHRGQYGNEKLDGTSLESSVLAVKKGVGQSSILLQVVTSLKSLFAVYHSPGCTASVTSIKGGSFSLKLDVEDCADLVTAFGCASAEVCTSIPARFIRLPS